MLFTKKKKLSFIVVMMVEPQAVCRTNSALQYTVKEVLFWFMDIALWIYRHIRANHMVKIICSPDKTAHRIQHM